MKAHLCGLWDGANLWVQWDEVADEYLLEVRVVGEEQWRRIGGQRPLRKAWMVLPMWGVHATSEAPGADIEARVAIAAAEPDWVPCSEVTFARSRCLFAIEAGARGVHYQPGTQFHCIVEGAAAHYELPVEVQLAAGERVEVELQATLLTGYCQLDRPDDFLIRPALGTVIRNVAPSVDDIVETGRMSSILRVMPRRVSPVTPGGQPLKVAFGRRLF